MSEAQSVPGATGFALDPARDPGPAGAIDEQGRAPEDEREHLLVRAQHNATELEAIFSAHADGLIIYGPDGQIRAMNPAARELFGIAEGEGTDYRELVKKLVPLDEQGDPLDLDELPSRKAMRAELVKAFVIGVHTSRGRVWYSASAAPLRAADGSIAGAVVSCVDITHLRRLQEEREQVIRTLTHDARTRLNVIQTHGELLAAGAFQEEDARRRARIIVANTRQLAEIIDARVGGT